MYLFIFKPKKHKERKKQSTVEEIDVEPVPRLHHDIQSEKKAQEDMGTKHLPEVEKDKDKIKETEEIGQKETVETLDTGQLKFEVKDLNKVKKAQNDRVENLETGKRNDDQEIDIGTSVDVETGQERYVVDEGAEAQDAASGKVVDKTENESLETETFYSFQEETENQVVKSENESELGDECQAEIVSDRGAASNKTAVIKPQEPESKEDSAIIESKDKSNAEAAALLNVVTETKSDLESTESVQAIGQKHLKETVMEDLEVKDEPVSAEAESNIDNVSEVSEAASGVALGQKHIYPDLTKDIEQYKAELEEVGIHLFIHVSTIFWTPNNFAANTVKVYIRGSTKVSHLQEMQMEQETVKTLDCLPKPVCL